MIVYKETTISKQNAAEYQIGLVWTSWFQIFSFGLWFALCFVCLVISLAIFIKLIRRNDTNPVDELFDETSNLIQ